MAFSFGIVTAIGLIAGAIADQQYWQRAFAIDKIHLRKSFLFGAALFAIVPIALSMLGFIGAAINVVLPAGVDSSMIGIVTIAQLLPSWATVLFVVVLLAGLSSTLDSGLVAFASLFAVDISKSHSDKEAIHKSRFAMVGVGLFGLVIAIGVQKIPGFGLQHLWWVFNTIAACVVVPTILSLYWRRLTAKGVYYGVLVAFVVGIPLFVYGNVIGSSIIVVLASLFIIGISALFCVIFRTKGDLTHSAQERDNRRQRA